MRVRPKLHGELAVSELGSVSVLRGVDPFGGERAGLRHHGKGRSNAPILSYSPGARKRTAVGLAELEYAFFEACQAGMLFWLTLTLGAVGADFGVRGREFERMRRVLAHVLRRLGVPGHWCKELQLRGALHLHALLVGTGEQMDAIRLAWLRISGDGGSRREDRELYGVDVRPVMAFSDGTMPRMIEYASKHATKSSQKVLVDPETGEIRRVGRFTGWFGKAWRDENKRELVIREVDIGNGKVAERLRVAGYVRFPDWWLDQVPGRRERIMEEHDGFVFAPGWGVGPHWREWVLYGDEAGLRELVKWSPARAPKLHKHKRPEPEHVVGKTVEHLRRTFPGAF